MATINGTGGADVLKGSAGGVSGTLQDLIQGFDGDDVITGSNGDDDIRGGAGGDLIYGSGGNDVINGGSGDDVIFDGGGNDTVYAGEGNDTMAGDRGNDSYFGGKGFDTLDFSGATSGIKVDMHRGTASSDTTGTDTIKDIEAIVGSNYADMIRGSDGADLIIGGNGENVMRGGKGADIIAGGDDRDTFVWKTSDIVDEAGLSRGMDTIYGFNSSNDSLDLRAVIGDIKGLQGVDLSESLDKLDEFIALTDTADGTVLQVDFGDGFVNVALLADVHTGGATAAAWASDISMLA